MLAGIKGGFIATVLQTISNTVFYQIKPTNQTNKNQTGNRAWRSKPH